MQRENHADNNMLEREICCMKYKAIPLDTPNHSMTRQGRNDQAMPPGIAVSFYCLNG
jgi:hypothetical protein